MGAQKQTVLRKNAQIDSPVRKNIMSSTRAGGGAPEAPGSRKAPFGMYGIRDSAKCAKSLHLAEGLLCGRGGVAELESRNDALLRNA